MKRWLRIFKLRLIRWLGFKLTGSEKADLNYWTTLRNVGKLTRTTRRALRKLRKGENVILNGDRRCELIRYLKRRINTDKSLLKKAESWDMYQYEWTPTKREVNGEVNDEYYYSKCSEEKRKTMASSS